MKKVTKLVSLSLSITLFSNVLLAAVDSKTKADSTQDSKTHSAQTTESKDSKTAQNTESSPKKKKKKRTTACTSF